MDLSFGILLLVFVVCVEPFVPYDVKWFEQEVDHFNFYPATYGKSTYKQKYLVQDKWWNSDGGPIFLYTGNEAPITSFWNNSGFLFDIAPKFQALIVFAEHRYYGDSMPFGSQSFEHPYVDLLTVEQTLADFAQLTIQIKKERNATKSPVIAFGGSYGGMLSAWMRFKFPNIVDGAIAASAPIFLVARVVDRDFFFTDVTKDFHGAVPGCDVAVRQAFDEMEPLSKTAEGLRTISTSFNLCKALNSTEEYQRHLVGWIRNSFTSLAMFDYPYPTAFFSELPANPVKVACKKVVHSSDPIQGLAQAAGLFYGSPDCYDIWTEYVECADPTGCGTGPESLAWDYQACTEMLMPAGTNNVTDMFPVLSFTLDERAEYCKKRWGVEPRLDWMRVNMWGKDIQYSSNIVFSNGNLDPWHRGGVLKNVSDSLVAVMIDGGAHHLDLRSSNPLDPEPVKKARNIEVANIRKWIQEAKRTYRQTSRIYN